MLALGHSYSYSINNMKKVGVYLEDWPAYESVVRDLGKRDLTWVLPILVQNVADVHVIFRKPFNVRYSRPSTFADLTLADFIIRGFFCTNLGAIGVFPSCTLLVLTFFTAFVPIIMFL